MKLKPRVWSHYKSSLILAAVYNMAKLANSINIKFVSPWTNCLIISYGSLPTNKVFWFKGSYKWGQLFLLTNNGYTLAQCQLNYRSMPVSSNQAHSNSTKDWNLELKLRAPFQHLNPLPGTSWGLNSTLALLYLNFRRTQVWLHISMIKPRHSRTKIFRPSPALLYLSKARSSFFQSTPTL